MTVGVDGRQMRSSATSVRGLRARFGDALTPREAEVLGRICSLDEPTAARAAADLGITEGTLTLHLGRCYRKLGVTTRLGAYRVAVEQLKMNLRDWR